MCRENYNNVPAFYAVWFEHYEVLKFFLNELKVNPLVSGDLNQTLFHRAASTGCLKIWNLLASVVNKQHTNPNTKDINGTTPLHLACKAGHIDIVKQILKHNPCTVLPLDGHEQNPLHYAARTNQLEIIKFLTKEKGFDLLPRDVIGDTPLHFAARRDHLEIVEFYKSQLKSCLRIQNDIGGTPQFLLEHIPVEEVPTLGQNPLHLAAETGKINHMKRILTKISPNSTDQLGRTPLHYAAMKGKSKAVNILLHAKATPLTEDVFHNLPLCCCSRTFKYCYATY